LIAAGFLCDPELDSGELQQQSLLSIIENIFSKFQQLLKYLENQLVIIDMENIFDRQ